MRLCFKLDDETASKVLKKSNQLGISRSELLRRIVRNRFWIEEVRL